MRTREEERQYRQALIDTPSSVLRSNGFAYSPAEEMSGMTFSNGASSASDDGNNCSDGDRPASQFLDTIPPQLPPLKRKRNLPGTPDPEAEVIALSPRTLMATNRFVCEICNKGFQRDQNLQLHRRGHNLPWKLRQRSGKIQKRVYVCPEPSCVHHDASRALGDLTGIKKHFCRKHGEKRWKCDKCEKQYAVQSDWKAHSKICGTREYRCDCGTLFSRKDSFVSHRAFCEALAEESARISSHIDSENASSIVASVSLSIKGPPSTPPPLPISTREHTPIHKSSVDPLSSRPRSRSNTSTLPINKNGFPPLAGSDQCVTTAHNPSSTQPSPILSLWLGSGPQPLLGSNFPYMMQTGLGSMGGDLRGVESKLPTIPMSPINSSMATSCFPAGSSSKVEDQSDLSPFSEGFSPIDWNTENMAISNTPSFYNQQRISSSAPLSATALLQKAAQMGATMSNPSLIKAFGLSDATSMESGWKWQYNQESKKTFPSSSITAAATTLHSSSSPMAWSSDDMQSLFGSQERSIDNLGVQDIMTSLPTDGGDLNMITSSFGPNLGATNGLLLPVLSSFSHVDQKPSNPQSTYLNRGLNLDCTRMGLGPLKEGGDKMTHDFLGVGGASHIMGSTTSSVGRSISHRDIASLASFSSERECGSILSNQKGNNVNSLERR